MNVTHRIRKDRKSNHGGLLRHDLLFVPQYWIILSKIVKGFLNEVRDDTTNTLPPFLYIIISPDYLHPSRLQERLIQSKLFW